MVSPTNASQSHPLNSVNLNEFSYQHPQGIPEHTGSPPKTTIDYGFSSSFLEEPLNSASSGRSAIGNNKNNHGSINNNVNVHLPHMRGDASLRPNTGNINASNEDPLGLSLQEITTYLRWLTIVSTCAAIVWEGFAFPLRLIGNLLTDPSQPVLGAYLGFFCLLVLGAETNNESLKDSFGFLYYPLSRGLMLLIMSTMCLGILNLWWESMLGLAFGAAGAGYLYTYIKYPEYRRWHHYNERMPTAWEEAKMYWYNSSSIRTASWADASAAGLQGFSNTSETQSLLST